MIALFRINDPYRLVLVLLILVGIRMPYLTEEIIPTITQFRWMLVGERLAEGSFLYEEVYDYIAPFSGLTFQAMDFLFGRSMLASAIASIIVVLIQSIIFNNLLLANKTYNEGTYLPAYFYVVLMSIHFDFLALSPALLSLTFILLALSNIFKRIDNQTKDELFMGTGIYLGIAAMFYLPSVIIFFTFLVILVIYSNSLLRRLMLMSVGFFMVILLVIGYYYQVGILPQFKAFFLNSLWIFDRINYFSGWEILAFIAFPFALTLFSVFYINLKGKFANYQLKFQQAMLFLLVGAVIMLFLAIERAYFTWIYMMPVVAFFVVHLIILMKQKIFAESINIVILVVVFLLASYSYDWSRENESDYFLADDAPVILKDRKLVVLGSSLSMYQSAKSATPFINWPVSKRLFSETEYYDNLENILSAFENDPPDMILDESGVMPAIQEKIPDLKKIYLPVPNYPGYYRNINN